jgi:Flp pilus assembly pilin Flp
LIAPRPLARRAARTARLFLRSRSGSAAAEVGIIAGLLAASIAASLGMMANDFAAAFHRYFGTPS